MNHLSIDQIFSFETAKIPRKKPIPEKINEIAPNVKKITKKVRIDIGYKRYIMMKKTVRGIMIKIISERKYPNNK